MKAKNSISLNNCYMLAYVKRRKSESKKCVKFVSFVCGKVSVVVIYILSLFIKSLNFYAVNWGVNRKSINSVK
ncbi:MAG: hypothetical protein QW061_02915, partial [Candidatus Rehaiarchaeum fermentans]|nr:hypothetical protein [Candidatus Rehaiarchaeum fermentans]